MLVGAVAAGCRAIAQLPNLPSIEFFYSYYCLSLTITRQINARATFMPKVLQTCSRRFPGHAMLKLNVPRAAIDHQSNKKAAGER